MYSLTEKGLDLIPLMPHMILWSAQHDPKTAAPKAFVRRIQQDREGLAAELRAQLGQSHRPGGVA